MIVFVTEWMLFAQHPAPARGAWCVSGCNRSLRDKGLGKGVKKGRIWTYVRDQRPWAGAAPPGAVYYFAPDWKEEHVHHHLRQISGILQASLARNTGQLRFKRKRELVSASIEEGALAFRRRTK
ncbi:hypothetical protein SM11_pC1244 (plasmid) [Sinorhizobium meliloti SM11]|uniref:Transposase IS66 central domain-containing protein n=1 Tax=Sinorhizobium meliloti (strain SM11) TaxID=707241 RepID=F7XFJ7_SINMM|nr:hypothetical protein SM11_pC1244 [Sinorhizobium meliloti SM11]